MAPEFLQPDGLEIDGVDGGHRVDERAAGVAAGVLGERALGGLAVAQHVSVDESHHIERCAVHAEVVAEPLDGWNGNGGVLERRQDPVFTTHVVRAREDVAERRPTQHQRWPAGAGDAERQVRVAAGDHIEPERSDRTRRRSTRTTP